MSTAKRFSCLAELSKPQDRQVVYRSFKFLLCSSSEALIWPNFSLQYRHLGFLRSVEIIWSVYYFGYTIISKTSGFEGTAVDYIFWSRCWVNCLTLQLYIFFREDCQLFSLFLSVTLFHSTITRLSQTVLTQSGTPWLGYTSPAA